MLLGPTVGMGYAGGALNSGLEELQEGAWCVIGCGLRRMANVFALSVLARAQQMTIRSGCMAIAEVLRMNTSAALH